MECKDINERDENGNRHGFWTLYWNDDSAMAKGNYIHGKKHGYWVRYYAAGSIMNKGNYFYGKQVGYWETYSRFDGFLLMKEFYI